MRMDKLTSKFQLALSDAQSVAVGMDHQLIEPSHVMVALLDQEGGASRHLLRKAGVRVDQLRSKLSERLESLPRVSGAEGEINLSNDLIKILNLTDKLAQKRNDQYIASELFILAAMDITLNVTLSECHPMLPMESYRLGVPCLMSRTSDLFIDAPDLYELTTVDQADNPEAIAGAAARLLEQRSEATAQAGPALDAVDRRSADQWHAFTAQ